MRTLMVLTALFTVVFAGCTDSNPDSYVPEDATVITDPLDFTNGTTGGFHIHDYWNGQDSITVIEENSGLTCLGCIENSWTTEPEDGSFVPQGTSQVDIAVNWTNAPQSTAPAPELWVKTADDKDPQFIADIVSGETITIATTLEDADLPHQFISGWELRLHWGDASSTEPYSISQTWSIKMVAVRGLELPVFPPHPDHWADKDHIDLFSEEQTVTNAKFQKLFLTGSSFRTFAPDDGVIVPWGTEKVVVTLANQGETGLELYYHAADSSEYQIVQPTGEDGGATVYEIPVQQVMADGPYATQSLWEFHVDAEAVGVESRNYSGTYTLTAVAYPEA